MGAIKKITPIMCNTLQEDDVQIAMDLLDNEESWADPSPVRQAEEWLAGWLGVERAFGFMGGRASLYAIVKALGISDGDEVVLPGFTCQVVVNAFEYNGATCVHADIEPATLSMDANRFAEKITPQTRAVLLQHTFGMPARDTEAIVALARERNIIVIEDTAHALGAKLNGQKLGTFGDVSFFSSERTKMINTIHGGFAASNNPDILANLEKIYLESPLPDAGKINEILNTLLFCYYTKVHPDRLELSAMAQEKYGSCLIPQMTDVEFKGQFEPLYACRMPGAIGRLAVNQLEKFETFIPKRQDAAEKWRDWALLTGYLVPIPAPGSYCSWVRYPVIVPPERKQDTSWIEKDLGMEPGVWFTTPCHPGKRTIPDIPIGWRMSETVINLPTGLWVK